MWMQDQGDGLPGYWDVVSKRICGAEAMSLKEFDKACAAITQRAMTRESRDPRKHTMHPERIEECADICMGALCAVLQRRLLEI